MVKIGICKVFALYVYVNCLSTLNCDINVRIKFFCERKIVFCDNCLIYFSQMLRGAERLLVVVAVYVWLK